MSLNPNLTKSNEPMLRKDDKETIKFKHTDIESTIFMEPNNPKAKNIKMAKGSLYLTNMRLILINSD